MRISDNIAQLAAAGMGKVTSAQSRLTELGDFGMNPGNLRGYYYLPPSLAEHTPLVVVLHGCTQTAALYDHGSGWSMLADKLGFMLLFPEQQRANNGNLCFNWFQPNDVQRGQGEAASIRQMIAHLCSEYPIDGTRIFCTGLSAGGAMTSVMLATYPEVFAAGAIIAGLPYGCVGSVQEALGYMHGRPRLSADGLSASIRAASVHSGQWPRISVWHGTADPTVSPTNADDIVKQWLELWGLPTAPSIVEDVDGHARLVWLDSGGQPAVEQYTITGLGHGVPLSPGDADGQSGRVGPHMLAAGISSTDRIAAFFGIGGANGRSRTRRRQSPLVDETPSRFPESTGIRFVIENALRGAGLMR